MLPSTTSVARSAAAAAGRRVITAEFLTQILKELTQPFLLVSADGRPLLWNPALEELSGYRPGQLLELTLADLVHPQDREAVRRSVRQSLQHADPQVVTCNWQARSGDAVPVEMRTVRLESNESEPLLLLVLKNLSERQRLEAELRQSQKMEAIGKLAGGIAHDFNNVLTTILSLADAMIQGHTPPNAESLREIHQAARHAAELTHHLLAFSRRQILQMRNVQLDAVVENMVKMVSRVIGEDIRLEIACRRPLPPIRADQPQIEQVLLNLCLNARDAMPHGGELRIEVRAETLTEAWCRTHKGSRPGSYVLLSVRDTGVGMDEETLSRLFEPFFTRKGLGRGTGLGLSMVYGIVKQHEGFIQVSSKLGSGSEFCIYFPASEGQPEQPAPQPEAARPVVSHRGSATILVVEDEASIRKLVLELLPKLGYRVFTAADGEEAIRVFERYADQIDVVLLDAVLPKLGGRAVYDAIRLRKPSVRFVFSSGYNEEFINNKFELDPNFLFLSKPFSTKDLSEKIRAALG